MAIFPSRPRPIGIPGNFPVRASGSNRQAGAYHPASAHTASLLAQASRVPRLANIGSVQALLRAHASIKAGGGNRGRK
jgi:hypothetical protein